MKPMIKLKIVLLGCSGVGKTCLLHSYLNTQYLNEYMEQHHPTVLEMIQTHVESHGLNVEIWDIGGSGWNDPNIGLCFERKEKDKDFRFEPDTILLCYEDESDLKKIKKKWYSFVKKYCDTSKVNVFLVGLKSDLNHEINLHLLKEIGHHVKSVAFLKCSSKNPSTIQDAFFEIFQQFFIKRTTSSDNPVREFLRQKKMEPPPILIDQASSPTDSVIIRSVQKEAGSTPLFRLLNAPDNWKVSFEKYGECVMVSEPICLQKRKLVNKKPPPIPRSKSLPPSTQPPLNFENEATQPPPIQPIQPPPIPSKEKKPSLSAMTNDLNKNVEFVEESERETFNEKNMIEQLQAELKMCRNQNTKLEEEIIHSRETYEQELQEYAKEISHLKKQNSNLKSENAGYRQEIKKIKSEAHSDFQKNVESSKKHKNITRVHINSLEHLDYISRGSFGEVYKGNLQVAIKKVDLATTSRRMVFKEVMYLSQLTHRNVLKCFGLSFEKENGKPRYAHIVMELCESDIEEYFRKRPNMLLSKKVKLLVEIARGMYYIHTKGGILHRDLKPQNVLVDSMGSVKIADFGASKSQQSLNFTFTGTPIFLAPEVFKGVSNPSVPFDINKASLSEAMPPDVYDHKIDIYSFGIMCHQLLCGKKPFMNVIEKTQGYMHALKIIHNSKPPLRPDLNDLPPNIPKALKKVIESCWDHNPNNRPNSFKVVGKALKKVISEVISQEEKNVGLPQNMIATQITILFSGRYKTIQSIHPSHMQNSDLFGQFLLSSMDLKMIEKWKYHYAIQVNGIELTPDDDDLTSMLSSPQIIVNIEERL